ncbi:rod shape-determining protein RodA [Lysinibacillus sphaericus]|uniref:Rod shape-determining protein RodA n=4 Tax=Lysinibacillus TaxID=400634 RepID=A0A2S0JVW4_LYSSH|nr:MULTISPECIES: FtsW/RodA/SpoVE family cell cycle protein [Lysinibacillus]AHN23509.1 cell division protein FtsW [Lysinibacillus varians]AVK95246.1 rod shape-determining protein RodA [Lysinibacillus sphaericus]MCS1381648.1 rod shape-determining protein RodA [Lysinibacillus sphaericus]MED4545109.1 FtsW/RodA/SpoVE family cell cycle protein [Lysinibacillus sphaericus]TKI18579.1 rod shape-determining protein RodA [Lysinibacillus sphaericus]
MENKRNFVNRFDWTLAFILFTFLVISLLAIASAQTSGQYGINYVPLQLRWYVIGAFIIGVIMFFEPDQYKKMAWYMYGAGIALLVLLIFMPEGKGQIGEPVNGAKSWFHTPLGNIQPSEFMKTFYILALARLISKHHEVYSLRSIKSDFILLGKIALTLIIPLGIIMKQPDLGSALVFFAITAALVIVAGISWKILLPTFLGGAVVGGSLLWMALYMQEFLEKTFGFKAYQFARIYSWLDPYSYSSSDGYHLITSLNAIGSGEIFGKGFRGREVYVAENHTDFIFTVIGEEWGFIGASIVICIFFLLIYHLTKTTLLLKDPFSTYVCAGIIAMITFHVFENIGMTIQLLPITGIPLPFISYGGSSLMGNALAIGLVFSMRFHYRTYMFTTYDEED